MKVYVSASTIYIPEKKNKSNRYEMMCGLIALLLVARHWKRIQIFKGFQGSHAIIASQIAEPRSFFAVLKSALRACCEVKKQQLLMATLPYFIHSS